MRAERFIADKLNDPPFLAGIKAHQTQALIAKFEKQFPGEVSTAAVLDRVALMTPENIHLNSFMYEPIIDMGEDHLRKLYTDVKALGITETQGLRGQDYGEDYGDTVLNSVP